MTFAVVLLSIVTVTLSTRDIYQEKYPYSEYYHEYKKEEPCTDCWCLPPNGPDGQCPPLQDRKLHYTKKDRLQYQSFDLTLTPYKDLPHLYPQGETPDPTKDGAVCTPYPDLQKKLKLPSCEPPIDYGEDAVCAFYYNNTGCNNRNYGMKTYSTWDDAVNDDASITHLGGMYFKIQHLPILLTLLYLHFSMWCMQQCK